MKLPTMLGFFYQHHCLIVGWQACTYASEEKAEEWKTESQTFWDHATYRGVDAWSETECTGQIYANRGGKKAGCLHQLIFMINKYYKILLVLDFSLLINVLLIYLYSA